MTPQHTGLTAESWGKMPFLKRLANIGSEVIRAIKWKEKKNPEYADLAFIRALELFDLTYQTNTTESQQKELCRLREAWVDYYKYDNTFKTDSKFWNNYFNYITVRAL
jgi:hypothetical protein